MDYQLVLSDNVDAGNPTGIRNNFSLGMKRAYIKKECCNLQSSKNVNIDDLKSVITVSIFENDEKQKLKFSIDFATVGYNIKNKDDECSFGKSSITRRNAQGDNQQMFTWNELPSKHNQSYIDYKAFSQENKIIVRNNVVERKIKLKSENEKYKSFIIFIEEVNNMKECLHV